MTLAKLIQNDELYFLDLETVAGSEICQIGITKWSSSIKELKIVFNQDIKPDIHESQFNNVTMQKIQISRSQINRAESIEAYIPELVRLISDKIILHWGGSDGSYLKKSITDRGEKVQFSSCNIFDYFSSQKLEDATMEYLNIKGNAFHNAAFDSFLAALVFLKRSELYSPSLDDLEKIREFNEQFSNNNRYFAIRALKSNDGKAGEVCLTGFKGNEKQEIVKEICTNDYKIVGSVTDGLKYLIIPTPDYNASTYKINRAKLLKKRIVDIETFRIEILKNGISRKAS